MRADGQLPAGSNDAVTQAAQAAQAARVELAREAQQARIDAEMARVRAEMARAQAERARAVGELAQAQARGELRDVRVTRGPDGHTVVTLPNGRTISIDASAAGTSPDELLHEAGVPLPPAREAPIDFVRLGLGGALLCGLLALVWYVARVTGRRAASTPAPALSDVDARLRRIEHAVDAIAVEVERVSEAQRFAAGLLAERAAAVPRPAPRRDTPTSVTPLS
jgi:hypothetical protein